MTIEALTPNSRWTRLPDSAASAMILRPTAVEPVKETIAISRWATRCSPTSRPRPAMMLMTPSGIPAALAASSKSNDVLGVFSAGLSTIVFPSAIADRTFQAAICSE
ncbi:hypothetical protein GCM10025778_29820 [Paeniglutamicibacter antarcticus]|uniref:Uncharacterized protein n=1 Tax=Paeniglutamicibacter antarcticus TaxID=494023 RepID=A0ABP9TRQ1_9MICC